MSEESLKRLENMVRSSKKDDAVWLQLYFVKPEPGPIKALRKDFDREGDVYGQIFDHLKALGYHGAFVVKVTVRQPGKDNDVGAANIDIVLPAAPEPQRVENPPPTAMLATDLAGIKQRVAEMRELRELLGGGVEEEEEDEEEDDDEDCAKCGFPLSSCACDLQPTGFDLLLRRVVTHPELMNGVDDVLSAIGHRIRFGVTKPPKDVEVQRTSVTLVKDNNPKKGVA